MLRVGDATFQLTKRPATQAVRRSVRGVLQEPHMSDETLKEWRDCTPTRFGKPVDELNEDDLANIADSLCSYIRLAARDHGIFLSGQDPREFDMLGRITKHDADYQAPVRNET